MPNFNIRLRTARMTCLAWAFSIRHSPVSMMRCVPAAYMPHRMSRCGEAGWLGRLPPPRLPGAALRGAPGANGDITLLR